MENIVLIGMPGAGKSTIGVVLAKIMGYQFLDSDLLIQEQKQKRLFELIEEYGNDEFLQIENQVNQSILVDRCIIATGGSAIYGKEAMEHLRNIGTIVYLDISYFSLKKRLGDLKKRGVTLKDGQTLKNLYAERVPYYKQYADIKVSCERRSIQKIALEIATKVKQFQNEKEDRESM